MRASFSDGALAVVGADIRDSQEIGAVLGALLQDGDVVFLNGQLGAGKTSLAQAIAQGLGVDEDVVSPTFNIACRYESGRIPLNHLDLYRLDSAAQLDDVAFWELVDEGTPGASLIEWAELFAVEMPDEGLSVQIAYPVEGDAVRGMSITAAGARAETLLQSIAEAII